MKRAALERIDARPGTILTQDVVSLDEGLAPPPIKRAGAKSGSNPLDSAWHLLTSVRFVFFLLIGLAGASLAGILIIQVPAELSGDAADYAQWLERVRPKFGPFTDLLSLLGLFNVFHSFWFRTMVGLLTLSIIVCSLNRWPGIRHSLTQTRVRVAPGFFRAVPLHTEITVDGGSLDTAASAMVEALKSRGYRVLEERDGAAAHYYADKNRHSQLGTFALHLGLVLVLVVALWSSIAGFRDRAFAIPEGSVRAVGAGTDLVVKLESFADEYYAEGPPKDYRSELVLYKGPQEVRRQTVRVNEPLEYEGWRFHQSFFGPAAVLEVRDAAGRTLFSDGVALSWRTKGDRPAGSFRLPEQNLTVYLIGPSSGTWDDVIKAGELRLEVYRGGEGRPIVMENIQQGQPQTAEGLTFTFQRERQFTGLQVVHDPTAPLMYFAWVLMSLGLLAVFYFPYRRLWARCQQEADGTLHVSLGTSIRRDLGLTREYAAVEEAVRSRLNLTKGRSDHV